MPKVTVGVPIYKGERYLSEALSAVKAQTFADFVVLMSLDGGRDPECERICHQFCDTDRRFLLHIQDKRLGWVGNINWLLGQLKTEFWYFQQQDDLVEPTYLEELVGLAQLHPSASLVYSDLNPLGRIAGRFEQVPSVRGTKFIRMLTMLHEHLPAFAFRGLTRATAVSSAGPIRENSVGNYGVDLTWLTSIARAGELIHHPRPLYYKRYHENNTESKWWSLAVGDKLKAWATHCADILAEVMRIDGTAEEVRLLWFASLERLTSPSVSRTFLQLTSLDHLQRELLIETFLTEVKRLLGDELPRRTEWEWAVLTRSAELFVWWPSLEEIRIEDYGPQTIVRGKPFNVQPDGSCALWVRASRYVHPSTKIELSGVPLDSASSGRLVTAKVPAGVIKGPEAVSLRLLDESGKAITAPVYVRLVEPLDERPG